MDTLIIQREEVQIQQAFSALTLGMGPPLASRGSALFRGPDL
jgi:hypothetical protein